MRILHKIIFYKVYGIYLKFYCIILFLFAALIIIPSCSGIKIEKSVVITQSDWLMAGGSAEQQHVSRFKLPPPLYLKWKYNIEGGVGSSGICVSDAIVFVNALQGEMFSFDVSSGGKIGNVKFLGKDASTAPLILGNDIILTYAGDRKSTVVSYNLLTGNITWKKYFGDIQTSPILYEKFVYFSSLNGTFYKINPLNGELVWSFKIGKPIRSTCAINSGLAVFGCDDHYIYSVNTELGTEIWKFKTEQPIYSTPLIYDGKVFIGGNDSIYYCLGLNSGKLIWKVNLSAKMIGGSAIDKDKNVITGCIDSKIVSLKSSNGEINWKTYTKGTIVSSPVISDDYIYITSYDGYLYCLGSKEGNIIWKYEMENKSKTTPVVWQNYLFTAADDIVYCFTNNENEIK